MHRALPLLLLVMTLPSVPAMAQGWRLLETAYGLAVEGVETGGPARLAFECRRDDGDIVFRVSPVATKGAEDVPIRFETPDARPLTLPVPMLDAGSAGFTYRKAPDMVQMMVLYVAAAQRDLAVEVDGARHPFSMAGFENALLAFADRCPVAME